MSRVVGKGKKGGKRKVQQARRQQIDEEKESDTLEGDEDLLMNEQNNQLGGIDQEQLTAEEKEEQVFKTLTSENPQAPHNLTKFSYKDHQYKTEDIVEQMVFHFQFDGDILIKDSDEATDQDEFWENKKRTETGLLDNINREIKDTFGKEKLDTNERDAKKSLRNQFNFQERSSQTFNLPLRERGIKTDPPQTSIFSVETSDWMIFDAYMNEFIAKEKQEFEENQKGRSKDKKSTQQQQQHVEDPLYSTSMKRALKIMERMIVQNADDEKFEDYKYYVDETEDPENHNYGSVLPLWRFSTEKSRKKNVTTICWNPKYKDLFAVGYGSYEFLKQSTGLICCYTIKNPTYPEYQFTTESGVMCLDFHKLHPALLAVGCYDGTVMVFDIRIKGNNKPIYQSTVRTCKHTDPVWQVRWQDDEGQKNLNFYSISSDGRVTNWTLMKNKLEAEEVIKLKLVIDQDKELVENKKEAFLYGLAGGMCFDFNKYQDHLFLVGTEEGKIHLCSKAYSGQYLETYEGHYLAVYAVKWNHYHPRVFLSCSADWTIKMWDSSIKRPITTFDLQCAVGDVEWAPYSSTVFAAVTYNGMLCVYDLKQEKKKHLCEHPAMKKAKAYHVSFNWEDPIILVGDEKGGVNSFKLSKALTKGPMEPQVVDEKTISTQELEEKKMEDFLNAQDKEVY